MLLWGGIKSISLSFPLKNLTTAIIEGGLLVRTDKIYVEAVKPPSPAGLSGIQPGDVILSINDQVVRDIKTFVDIIDQNRGKQVNISIERNGIVRNVNLVPRLDPPLGEGPSGLTVSNFGLKKESFLLIIPKVIFEAYSGKDTEVETALKFYRIYLLSGGILFTLSGYGLLKFKKWALWLTLITAIISFYGLSSDFLISIFTQTKLPLLNIAENVARILLTTYVFSQRKFFK